MDEKQTKAAMQALRLTVGKAMGENGSATPRATEQAVLKAIHEALPSGSYLVNLISRDLVKWFEYQTDMDLSCDVIEWKYSEGKRAGEAAAQAEAASDAKSREIEIKGLQKLLTAEQEKVKQLEEALAAQKRRVADLEHEGNELYNGLVAWQQRTEEAEQIIEAIGEVARQAWFSEKPISGEGLKQAIRAARREYDEHYREDVRAIA